MTLRTAAPLLIATLVILALGLSAIIFLQPSNASMGDWGDYVGGLVGVVTLIWLVAGHIENQIELRRAKEDLRQQAEFTQDAIGALTRIAAGAQVQAAEVLTAAEPLFVHLSSAPISTGRSRFQTTSIAQSGYIEMRNEGGSAFIVRIESQCENFLAQVEGPHILAMGATFKLLLTSKKSLSESGEIDFLIHVKDKFGRSGRIELAAPRFESPPTIRNEMGQVS